MSDAGFETRGEAIVAALDMMEEGDTLVVHEPRCAMNSVTIKCTCDPERWTY